MKRVFPPVISHLLAPSGETGTYVPVPRQHRHHKTRQLLSIGGGARWLSGAKALVAKPRDGHSP